MEYRKYMQIKWYFWKLFIITSYSRYSKWKLNNKIKINNIFKGFDSLLIVPNISKWNIDLSECLYSSSKNSISIKIIKSNSLYSEKDIIKFSNLSEESPPLKSNNDAILFGNNDFKDSKNEELDDYYNNFYN